MSQSLLYAFLIFAVVMFFTPGPNNIMLMASGVNFGFRRTLPHVAGVTFGFAFMIGVTGLGFGAVFAAVPVLRTVLKYCGVVYLIYLAIAIGRAGAPDPAASDRRRPMTFLGAALFQWVNVKGWVMAIGTTTTYAAVATYPWNAVMQVALSVVMGALSSITWSLGGSALRPLLRSPGKVRTFNMAMAALLLASLYPALVEA